ncbi:MAG: phytoene dehydrogenase [Chitinophagaceae bacterium]|nr:phytoene dehydrogenase [Chitinophagaceae bacterium]
MEEFDTIVIGSGAGGLAAALCLAKAGQKVLVVEQHYVPGGWCHSFHLNGQRFSPGVHYIGLVDEGDSTNDLYKGLGIANELVFFRMNKKAYEHCHLGTHKIDLPAGIDNLYESLAMQFPHERKNIKKYLALVKKVSEEILLIPKMHSFWDHLTIPFRTRNMGKYGLFSLKRVLNWHIKDPVLKGILNIQCGDYGLPPFMASFPVHCVLMSHYFQGGFYPMGGGAGIVKAMTNAFKSHGGTLRVKQSVTRILVEEQQAIGIELADGQRILAKHIISNADPSTTYLKLVGKEKLSSALLKKLSKTRYSVASLILFLTLDMDVTLAGLDSGNIWSLKNEDIDDIYHDLKENDPSEGTEFPAVFISCTTLKDPVSFNGRYHSFEVVTFIEYDSFRDAEQADYHSEAYEVRKQKIVAKFLNNVEKVIPGAKQHVVQAELGTPKTNQHFINTTEGNVYGTEKSFDQIGPFSFGTKTEIHNLFLCGASTLSHGVTGASYSGVDVAAKILNTTSEALLQSDPDQFLRIYDAEDRAEWPLWMQDKIAGRKKRFKEI